MEHLRHWTSSTNWGDTYSGGPQRLHYVMPLEENQYKTVRGLIDSDPVYGVLLTPTTLSLLTSHDEPEEYQWKRAYACLGALAMPREGLDEQLESTIDRFHYYKEMLALPPPSPYSATAPVTAEFVGFTSRPEFIIGE